MSDNPVIFCAIDTPDLSHACALAIQISPLCGLKLGLEFFNAHGPGGIEAILKAAPDASLFIDLKFHDIPNTVAGAVRSICANFSPAYLNVHASGGLEMMQAAQQACGSATRLLGVTILTSLNEAAISAVGFMSDGVEERVKNLALLTQKAGLTGVVCSAHEIEALRGVCNPDFVLMVPGIRPEGASSGDQKRVMTPKQALQLGATHLVIGRPITESDDPSLAAQTIIESI
jgi:orotidine-5'-phosphate decarboxylase